MERIAIAPRPNFQEIIKRQGFIYHDLDNYYTETAAYRFNLPEVEKIEEATATLYDMCLQAVDHIIDHNLWDTMHIPEAYRAFITESWRNDDCSIYSRFDLAYDGQQLKLLELNADTPTGLLEAAVIQWHWLQDYNSSADQFNSIHEKLIAHFEACKPWLGKLFFSSVADSSEDYITVSYLQDCAAQAGYQTAYIEIEELSLDGQGRFVAGNEPIEHIFKLYPWEWMFQEAYGANLLKHTINWIEPPYKALLSNKMILPVLWKLFPNHPLLLKSSTEPLQGSFVKKPIFGREGANVTVVSNGKAIASTDGMYGEEGYVFQEYLPIPTFEGYTPIIGSWTVGGEPAGMGIRESQSIITGNTAHFVPHFIG